MADLILSESEQCEEKWPLNHHTCSVHEEASHSRK